VAKTPKRTGKQAPPRIDFAARAKADKAALQRRLRDERAIVTLSRQLERAIRQSDYRLLELGGALMARGSAMHQADADADVQREAAIAGRHDVDRG